MDALSSIDLITHILQLVGLGAVIKIAYNTGKMVKLIDDHEAIIKDHETRLRIVERNN